MSERRYYTHEAEVQAMRERSLLILVALSLGVGVGSALTLLFASEAGKGMRQDFSDMVEDRIGTMEDTVKTLRGKIEDRISDLT